MGNRHSRYPRCTLPVLRRRFGIDNLALERTMAGAPTGRRAMARRRAELSR
jgi:hypothetical protein